MLYHYHCHRPWRFAPCPHRLSRGTRFHPSDRRGVSRPRRPIPERKFSKRNRPPVCNGGDLACISRADGRESPRKPRERRYAGTHAVHAADLSSSTGSKDDGTHGTVAAPSDSKPRTGRPTRLNTWEIAALPLPLSLISAANSSLLASFFLPCHPLSTPPRSVSISLLHLFVFSLHRSRSDHSASINRRSIRFVFS